MWLVERSSIVEHGMHGGHLGDPPLAELLVEPMSISEPGIHGGHLEDSPIANRLVEPMSIAEHGMHGGCLAGAHVFIEAGFVLEEAAHLGNEGGIPAGYIPCVRSPPHHSSTAS